jgi:hypothetical protein
MPAPKGQVPAPIDRPLSRAYLREFSGWSTAYPPGLSDPTSLRIMENVMINRDGSARLRPGLRYMSYDTAPDDAGLGAVPIQNQVVGTHEAFYLNDGSKAYLFAVIEDDATVGFRVLRVDTAGSVVYELDAPGIAFEVDPLLNFTSATTYVKYLQIDNKIFALSNAGEPMRLFYVGNDKRARRLNAIERPSWTLADKLTVVHPDAAWVNSGTITGYRYNVLPNPSFEANRDDWLINGESSRVTAPSAIAGTGTKALRIESMPERTNLAPRPLHTSSIAGWNEGSGTDAIIADSGALLATITPGPTVRTGYVNMVDTMECVAGETYRATIDVQSRSGGIDKLKIRFRFYGSTGAQVGSDTDQPLSSGTGRRSTGPVTAPAGAVKFRVYPAATTDNAGTQQWRFHNVLVAQSDEPTTMFTGASGANYFWTGTSGASASVYHPPKTVAIGALRPANNQPYSFNGYVRSSATGRTVTMTTQYFGSAGLLGSGSSTPSADASGSWTRYDSGATGFAGTTQVLVNIQIAAVPRGEYHLIDGLMLEAGVSTPGAYFDGDTADTSTRVNSWFGTVSLQVIYATGLVVPPAETKTADTLISSTSADNVYNFAFFYTIANEVGESAASRVTAIRAQRGWSQWRWESPNVAGEPSGNDISDPNLAADQLVATMPADVFADALANGATSWSLYMYTWSDQDPVPTTAVKIAERSLAADSDIGADSWLRMTPVVNDTASDVSVIPNSANRFNYSDPSRAANGMVCSDRMILVYDKDNAAVIRWTSNRQGDYTDFTANKGGGYKTLTSGNLFIPAAVKLWQNPQSADTITILCLGTDGMSTSYYMAPASVSSQSETVNVMGFEETTATPGTTSPYGVEVFNNALYHPLDEQLMKSTATMYNINHKSQTDQIQNVWERLATKQHIISSVHDQRLYYIVNNPDGEPVEPGCHGNEIWVMDAGATTQTWSRWTIQAHSLRKIEFGGQIYMSVIRPDGIFYLDPYYYQDDTVQLGESLFARDIRFRLETNTQGANRAHDAWAHVQQLNIVLGNFQGQLRYGIRGLDVHGKRVDISKLVNDNNPPGDLMWDFDDYLQIRRDMKEWFFYAETSEIDDGVRHFQGQINLVQYRYTPTTVNVGYEYGSVETFEYQRAAYGYESITTNGTPVPMIDTARP